jgi:hypothetical protein
VIPLAVGWPFRREALVWRNASRGPVASPAGRAAAEANAHRIAAAEAALRLIFLWPREPGWPNSPSPRQSSHSRFP